MMMLMFVDNFWVSFFVSYESWQRCIEDNGEEERNEEDEVYYKIFGLVPLRILFFDFGPSNYVTQHNDTSSSSVMSHVATSSSVFHIDVFVTDDERL